MRFRFANYWLSGTPSAAFRDDPGGRIVSKSASREQQVTGGPGWTYKSGEDRSNLWTRITFEAPLGFSTLQAAEEWVVGYEAANHHPWKGSLVIFIDGTPDTKVSFMHNALIQPPTLRYQGVHVVAVFQVEGPICTAPADYDAMLWAEFDDNYFFSGEDSPAAGQAFSVSGSNLVPTASISTADYYWESDGGGNYRPKA